MIFQRDLSSTAEATFSPCERYRYTLRRAFWGTVNTPPRNPVIFCMLNPSTATAFALDPTIRRCINFATAWGYSDLVVVNLFGIRETKSSLLRWSPDPVGPENDLAFATLPSGPIVCAWGAHPLAGPRAERVRALLRHRELFCLRRTKMSGAPEHPLYLPKHLTPIPYEAAWQTPKKLKR